ncbi:MAG: hypothetical protein K2L96_07820 [Muribaculaceae bacterium]|nr:hypothetical protein [Muribaculaceae bacterium]
MKMNRDRIFALCATVFAAAIAVVILLFTALHFDRSTLPVPPRPTTALIQEPEEFAELYTPEPANTPAETASPAMNPVPENNQATPAPATGIDTRDNGPAGEVLPPKTSSRPSAVKATPKETKTKPAGPVEDTKKQKEEEEARRKASADLRNAFANTKGQNNTKNNGRTPGNAGRPTGSVDAQQNGTGSGRVNGGWRMPSYAKVPSTVTGTIELKATINSQGKVTAVEVIGGQAPAATNAALAEACKAEIRRRTFTRSDSNAPESATAYITYRFN